MKRTLGLMPLFNLAVAFIPFRETWGMGNWFLTQLVQLPMAQNCTNCDASATETKGIGWSEPNVLLQLNLVLPVWAEANMDLSSSEAPLLRGS